MFFIKYTQQLESIMQCWGGSGADSKGSWKLPEKNSRATCRDQGGRTGYTAFTYSW